MSLADVADLLSGIEREPRWWARLYAALDALAVTPLENLLVETDAPYLTPTPWRGSANSPYLVPLTVRAMASTLSTDVTTLCRALSDNAERLYGPW